MVCDKPNNTFCACDNQSSSYSFNRMLEEKNKIKSKALFIYLRFNLSMWVFYKHAMDF